MSSAVVILGPESPLLRSALAPNFQANHVGQYLGPRARFDEVDEGSLRQWRDLLDILGIDVSKADFHTCLIEGKRQSAHSFPNNPKGYRQLQRWLQNRGASQIHACMEATGGYWMALARALFERGVRVSVVNPARTALFAKSQLRRTKTDRVDAQMIAEFCQTQRPSAWSPPPPEILELRGFLSYRHELVNAKVRLKQIADSVYLRKEFNELHEAHVEELTQAIASVDEQLHGMIEARGDLAAQVAKLESVSGIGFLTAATIVAKLPVSRLRDGKAAAAYVGLSPRERQSGTSVKGKEHICKTGDAVLRRELYMPAMTAIRYNPILAAFAARLQERGKPKKVIIVAVMRKLIVLAYNLLKELATAKEPVLA